ncbi:MAG: ERCC4 domain-containing protein [archaeon]
MPKEIENIFSKSSDTKVEVPNKFPIIVDTREKQSLVYSYLVQKNAKTQFEKLEIGDYLVGDVVVERKTFKDFQASIIDKRLMKQLIELKKYSHCFLLLEGFLYDYSDCIIHENAVRGMILSCAIDFGIPVLYSQNEEDTARLLLVLAKRLEKPEKENSLRLKKTEMTFEEQKQFILEGFPGIGPTTAKALLEKFKTLERIFNCPKSKLVKTELFDEKKLDNFKKILED